MRSLHCWTGPEGRGHFHPHCSGDLSELMQAGAGTPGLCPAAECPFGARCICLSPWSFLGFKCPLCGSQRLDFGSWAVCSQTSALGVGWWCRVARQ